MARCNGAYSGLSLLQLAMVLAAGVFCMPINRASSAADSSTALPTLSWSSELSISIDAGNGSAIIKGSALVSPDHKSWAFGVVVGTNTTDGQIPFSFGIFKAVDSSSASGVPTWEWMPVSSSDIASATVSFSPGEEILLTVKWRNGTGSSDGSVAWSSDTGGEAQAVALTNSGRLLLLDAENHTIWERPMPLAAAGPDAAPAPLAACPSNICLLPPPPASSLPAPPPPRRATPSPASPKLFPSVALHLPMVMALACFIL